jgi:hypothetical protein
LERQVVSPENSHDINVSWRPPVSRFDVFKKAAIHPLEAVRKALAMQSFSEVQKPPKNHPPFGRRSQMLAQFERRAGIWRQLTTIHRVSQMRREHEVMVENWNRYGHGCSFNVSQR